MAVHSVLMVCLGNICRSPMAEGILRHLAEKNNLPMVIDSAGTGGWHAGENPDRRATKAMKERGIDISKLVARQFSKNDFRQFDLILTMDSSNYHDVVAMAHSDEDKKKVRPILDYSFPGAGSSVPDPWYGDMDGFYKVYDMLYKACEILIDKEIHEKR